MSARNSRAVKAERRVHRARRDERDAPAEWKGVVSQAAIAEVVREVVEGVGAPLLPPEEHGLCWAYAAAGAMMSVLATGERHALQMGGYVVRDAAGNRVFAYGPGSIVMFRGQEAYHSWFTRVPAGADLELTWARPPWIQVCDLAPPGPVTRKAVAGRGGEALPDWVWASRASLRERFGLFYAPDRALTLRRVVTILFLIRDGVYFLRECLQVVCEVAARRLGLSMDGWVPLAPGSFLVGHRPGDS